MRSDSLPTLEYAAPKAFFDGAYRYRSWNGVVSSVVGTGLGIGLLFARKRMLESAAAGLGEWVAQGMGVLGAGALIAVVVTLLYMLQGRERPVRVTEHGITLGRRHWPWVRIARFGGMKYTGGIAITFHLHGRGHTTRILYTTPLLTADQFVALARTVKAFAVETNTHVAVVEKPKDPPSD